MRILKWYKKNENIKTVKGFDDVKIVQNVGNGMTAQKCWISSNGQKCQEGLKC